MKNFIKSLERSDNKTLIEAILKGYSVIFENNESADLVAEARKFKSADEFVRSRENKTVDADGITNVGDFVELYHGTSNRRANKISKEGFRIKAVKNQTMGGDPVSHRQYIYFAKKPDAAKGYSELHQNPAVVTVRIPRIVFDKLNDHGRNSGPVSFWSKEEIPSQYIYSPEQTRNQLIGIWNKAHSPQLGDEMDQSARGINESAELYASGMCDVFALALNKLYGYEPYVVRGYYKDGDEYAYEDSHAVVKSPKGFLDYKGLISEQELKKAAHFTNNIEFVKIEPVSVEELKECFTSEPIPEIEIEKAVDYIKNNNSLFEATGKSELQKLKDNKVPLTDDERKEVFKKDAVWHYASSIDPNTGEKVQKVSAVWKSKHPKTGDITYITHTHRAYNTAKSLNAIINKYHNFIKGTA